MLNLSQPSAFAGDPYGYVTNQMSHAALGALGFWFLRGFGAEWAVIVVLAAMALWEMRQALLYYNAWPDAVEDWAFVAFGALFFAVGGVGFGFWALLSLAVILLALGVWRRAHA